MDTTGVHDDCRAEADQLEDDLAVARAQVQRLGAAATERDRQLVDAGALHLADEQTARNLERMVAALRGQLDAHVNPRPMEDGAEEYTMAMFERSRKLLADTAAVECSRCRGLGAQVAALRSGLEESLLHGHGECSHSIEDDAACRACAIAGSPAVAALLADTASAAAGWAPPELVRECEAALERASGHMRIGHAKDCESADVADAVLAKLHALGQR